MRLLSPHILTLKSVVEMSVLATSVTSGIGKRGHLRVALEFETT